MKYIVELEREFKAKQGLESPVRKSKNLPSLQPKDGYLLALRIGISFDESQLKPQGWFIDTDSLEESLDKVCSKLAKDKWTEAFDFRPTFELVSRWVYENMLAEIPQLQYVEIENHTLGSRTRYSSSYID